jgi:uncharacterized protein (DUF58 family)
MKIKNSYKPDLFSSDFIRKLEKLKYLTKKALFSGTVGERTIKQKGGRIEFAGHRDYTAGDEPRYIDWNVYARLERLYVKEFASEQNLPIYILLDISTSMTSQVRLAHCKDETDTPKIEHSRRLALALAYVGLINNQPVQFFTFSETIQDISSFFESDKKLFEMLAFLRKIKPSGRTNLFSVLTKFDKTTPKRGFIFILSDLFDNSERDNRSVLARLNQRGFVINIFHIVSKTDALPDFRGIYRLKDSETDEEKSVQVEPETLSLYQDKFLMFSEDWNNFCLRHNIKYFYIPTAMAIEDVILRLLRKGKLLR